MIFWILALAGIALGFVIRKAGKDRRDKLKEYEFNHRTAGGVVEFANYEDSKTHNKARRKADSTIGRGNVLISFSIAAIIIKALVMH